MERITHKRTISQGEKHVDTRRDKIIAGELTEYHDSAYARVVQPQKVVVLPRYFITHWLPALGPSLAWLVLAFRQAAFVANCDQAEAVRALSVRKLSRWAGLSHGQIWNLIQKSDLLPWFVRRISRSTQRAESDVWGVRTSVPLAPHHLSILNQAIDQLLAGNPALTAFEALQALLPMTRDIRRAAPASTGSGQQPQTLHELLVEKVGPLDQMASQLADEVTARIVEPGNTIAITHYFIHRWRSEMTSGEAWMVHLLRMQVYSLQNEASFLTVTGGKAHLARALGVNTRSVRRWFSSLPDKQLAAFLQEQDNASTDNHLAVEILMREPLHETDREKYEESLLEHQVDKIGQSDGQNWTVDLQERGEAPDKNEQEAGQNWTDTRTKSNSSPDRTGQGGGQEWTTARTKLDTLIDLNQAENKTLEIKPPQQTGPHEQPVVVGGWDIDKILQHGGISPKKRQALVEELQQDLPAAKRFIGWFLYGYESKNRAGQGITSPILFAVSRFRDSRPAPVYLQLAAHTPADLARIIRNRFSPDTRPDRQAMLSALEANGLLDVLQDQHGEALQVVEAVPPQNKASQELQKDAVVEQPPEMLSAEALWVQASAIAGIEKGALPVSIWLNEQTLELSFMQEEVALSVGQALEARRTELRSRFPAVVFQLRTLEMVHEDRDALPVVGVKSELTVAL